MRTTNTSFAALSHTNLSGTERLMSEACSAVGSVAELYTVSANNWSGVVYFVRRSSG